MTYIRHACTISVTAVRTKQRPWYQRRHRQSALVEAVHETQCCKKVGCSPLILVAVRCKRLEDFHPRCWYWRPTQAIVSSRRELITEEITFESITCSLCFWALLFSLSTVSKQLLRYSYLQVVTTAGSTGQVMLCSPTCIETVLGLERWWADVIFLWPSS